MEPAGRRLAFEIHRDQQQGRVPGLIGGRGLVPLEETHRQVEDADALLLLVGLGVVVDGEEPTLEPFRSSAGSANGDRRGGGRATPSTASPPRAGTRRRARPSLRLGRSSPAPAGRHRLPLADEQAEDLLRAFVHDLDLLAPGRISRGADQPIARREVEQLLSRF